MEDIQKQINQKYKEVLELRFEMNRHQRYSLKWMDVQEKYSTVFEELKALENKKLKGGVKMAQNQSTKGSRKSARAKGEVLKDASSPELAKLAEAISSTVNKIAEAELGKENGKTVSPKILKKTTKQKAKAKRENGAARLQKKADAIKAIAKQHGTEMKRIFNKTGKRQDVVKQMEKHNLTESNVYQVLNHLGVIKTTGAQKKLARMKEAGLL